LQLPYCCATADSPSASFTPWQTFVTIGDFDYDISGFIKRHPGGSVIKSYAGKDATAAFTELHRCDVKLL